MAEHPHGTCWNCGFAFEECDLPQVSERYGTITYEGRRDDPWNHDRDRIALPFLNIHLCRQCQEQHHAASNRIARLRPGSTQWITKSWRAFYRKVKAGTIDIGMQVSIQLSKKVEGKVAIKAIKEHAGVAVLGIAK